MIATSSRSRFVTILAFLIALSAVLIAVQIRHRSLQETLTQVAQSKVSEYASADTDVTYKVTTSTPYILFGQPHGKIMVYTRPKGATGTQDITGIEHDYTMRDGKWMMTDSARCSAESCQVEGGRLFKRE